MIISNINSTSFTTIEEYLSTLLEPAGWMLIHSLWQLTLLAIMYFAVRAMVRFFAPRNNASFLYCLGCFCLAAMLIAPATTFGFYLSQQSSLPDDVPALLVMGDNVIVGHTVLNQSPMVAPFNDPIVETDYWMTVQEQTQSCFPWLVSLWIAGVLLLSARPLFGLINVRRLRTTGLAELPPTIERLGQATARKLQICRTIKFAQSSLVNVPTVIGYFKPVILLPASVITGLTTNELELIFAHELAHIRRNDYLMNLAQTIIETLLFFHPAIWLVSAQVRAERENCCDDLAVRNSENPADRAMLVKALLSLEQSRSTPPSLAANGSGNGSLVKRARRLIGPPKSQTSPWGNVCFSMTMVVILLAIAIPILIIPSSDSGHLIAQEPVSETDQDLEESQTHSTEKIASPESTASKALKNQNVEGKFTGTLGEAISQLSQRAQVNITFDQPALDVMSVSPETRVAVELIGSRSLETALNLILDSASKRTPDSGLALTFVVQDDVIEITTRVASDVQPIEVSLLRHPTPQKSKFAQPFSVWVIRGDVTNGATPLAEIMEVSLSPGENDIFTALIESGGMPGKNANPSVFIGRLANVPLIKVAGTKKKRQVPRLAMQLWQSMGNKTSLNQLEIFSQAKGNPPSNSKVIALTTAPGKRASFARNDVILQPGDVVCVEERIAKMPLEQSAKPVNSKLKRQADLYKINGSHTYGDQLTAIPAPASVEVLAAIRGRDGWTRFPNHYEIQKTTLAQFVDPPQEHPQLGPFQRHHSHYQFVIYSPKKEQTGSSSKRPALTPENRKEFARICIDHTHLHYFNVNEPKNKTVAKAVSTVDKSDQKLVAKTYFVGDLVVPFSPAFPLAQHPQPAGDLNPVPKELRQKQVGKPVFAPVPLNGITEKDAAPIIELIRNTILPDSWANEKRTEGGNIAFFPPTLSLIITNTQEVHKQLPELLEKLRELSDTTIEVRSSIVVLPETELKLTELPNPFVQQQDLRTAFQTNGRNVRKIQALATAKESWKMLKLSPFTLFNGQSNSVGWKDFEPLDPGYFSFQSTLHPTFRKSGQLYSCINFHNTDHRRLEAQLTCNSRDATIVDISAYVLPKETDQVALFMFRQLIIDDGPKR